MSAFDGNEYALFGQIADVSTADQVYVPVPFGGRAMRVKVAIDAAITVADATVTVKAAGTSVGTVLIESTGAAAGSVFEATLDGTEVPAGGTIEIETDGGSTTTAKAAAVVIIKR